MASAGLFSGDRSRWPNQPRRLWAIYIWIGWRFVSVRTSMFVLYSNHLVLVMVRWACMSNALSLLHNTGWWKVASTQSRRGGQRVPKPGTRGAWFRGWWRSGARLRSPIQCGGWYQVEGRPCWWWWNPGSWICQQIRHNCCRYVVMVEMEHRQISWFYSFGPAGSETKFAGFCVEDG